MDHKRFSNGRFDVKPYGTDTADSSFYNERESLPGNNRMLGKMYNNTFSDEPQVFPSKRGSSNQLNPPLNNKFKRRLINQPLKLDKKRIGRFQKQLAQNNKRKESDKGSVKIPSINPNRNSLNVSNSRLSRLMNNNSKGFSTSRNRNLKLNKSFNALNKMNGSLPPGKLHLNTINNSHEKLEVSSRGDSFEPSGSRTGRKLFNFKRDGSDNPIKLQRQIRELNKVIEDKDTQINFLKKTIKYTESNELSMENKILYAECKRLKELLYKFMKKDIDEVELDEEIKKTVNDAIGAKTLQEKFKSKKHAIDELIEDNNEDNSKTILKKRATVKFADDVSGKTHIKEMKKGDSKIIRQQTGYTPAHKKMIAGTSKKPNPSLDNIMEDGESISEKSSHVEHSESGNSSHLEYKPTADWSDKLGQFNYNELNISNATVSEDEISDLLADLRFLLQVFESNASKFLFKDKYLISYEDAIQTLHEKLRISKEEATKLVLYIVEFKGKSKKIIKNSNTLNSSDFQRRIEEMVGTYRKYDKESIQELIDSFFTPENQNYKPRFLSEMNDLSFVEKVSKNEFEKTMANIPFDINMKCLVVKLLRESDSLHMVSGKKIKNFVNSIKSKSNKHLVPKKKFDEFEEDSASMSTDSAKGQPNFLSLNKQFFVRFADFMFNNDLTLYQIIHKKIYDKMFNGREYELISAKSFFRILDDRGFHTAPNEREAIGNLLKNSNLIDVIEVNKIVKILEELDIHEDKPLPTKNFDYKHLGAPDIRQVNRIIEYMDKNNIKDIEDFLGKGRIIIIEVIGNNKREDIEIIDVEKFTECLEEKNLIENDELSDGIQMFFAISLDNMDKLMIRKMRK